MPDPYPAMKLAIVTHWLSKSGGGISAVVEDFSRALLARKNSVDVLGLQDPRWDGDQVSWTGAPAQAFPVVGPKAFGFSPRLRIALTNSSADIAHLHGIWMHPSADMLAWSRGGRPFLVSPHGMLDPWAVKRSAAKKRLVRLLYEDRALRAATCIHALNTAEADAIRAFGLVNPIAIIPNGVALPKPQQKQVQAPWLDLFPESAPVLLFLGRIHAKKNLSGLIRAISELKRTSRLGGWKLAVAGWGEESHAKEVRNLVDELDLHAEVSFLGPLFGAEKDAALRHASAFVLPSFSEGLPMAVLEAWAYGLPVAMTSMCNLPAGFECGAAIEIPTAPEQMVGPLTDFLEMSASDLEVMGRAGRTLVERDFSWDVVAASFVDLYKWSLGEGARPDFVFEANDEIGRAV